MLIQRAGGTAQRRLNVFVYGPPGSGKTQLGLTFPNPVLVDFEDGYLTAETMGLGNVPLLQPKTIEDLLPILENPGRIVAEIKEACDGYEPETFIFDSATTLQTMLMGRENRPKEPGIGILARQRNRTAPNTPSVEDYKELNLMMTGFFNLTRQMAYHTVITAHACMQETEDSPKGLNVDQSRVRYKGLPVLTGKLAYSAGGLADMFIYMESKPKGDGTIHTAHLRTTGTYEARHRLGEGAPSRIDNPKFTDLWNIYEKARRNDG